VLFYLHGDHLGSTAVATNAGGAKTNDVRYYAYGVPRAGDPAALPTDRAFTGQKLDGGTGLMCCGARYYDPMLGGPPPWPGRQGRRISHECTNHAAGGRSFQVRARNMPQDVAVVS